jgi:hypothetical protein
METSEGSLYGPEADRAAAVVRWARALAGAPSDLWSSQPVRVSITAAIPADITLLDIFICSQDPELLAFPWELVSFPDPFSHAVFGEAGRIERVETGEPAVPSEPPSMPHALADHTRVLVMSPRPRLQSDVPFGPTVGAALAAAARFPAKLSIDMIRPPTFEDLRRHLSESNRPDIVHFDGHGDSGPDGGRLFFEGDTPGEAVPVTGRNVAALFRDNAPDTILLNACRSSFHLPGQSTGSVARDIARALPESVVVAMTYNVGVPLVLRLMQTVYPAIGMGRDTSAAVAQVRRDLFQEWKSDPSEFAKPHFLTPRVFRARVTVLPFVAYDSSTAASLSAVEQSLLYWTEEALAIDRLFSRTDGVLCVVGMLGSGKSSMADVLRLYYRLTSSQRVIPQIIDCADDHSLPVIDADRAIVFTSGRDQAGSAVYRLSYPPTALAADVIRPALSEHTSASSLPESLVHTLGFELAAIASTHLASAYTLARLAHRMGPRPAVDHVRWGFRADFDDDNVRTFRAALSLDPPADSCRSFRV